MAAVPWTQRDPFSWFFEQPFIKTPFLISRKGKKVRHQEVWKPVARVHCSLSPAWVTGVTAALAQVCQQLEKGSDGTHSPPYTKRQRLSNKANWNYKVSLSWEARIHERCSWPEMVIRYLNCSPVEKCHAAFMVGDVNNHVPFSFFM